MKVTRVPVDFGAYEITFGQHKGQAVRDVPTGYLQWLIKNGRASDHQSMRLLIPVAKRYLAEHSQNAKRAQRKESN